jgi:TetR/AcrR family transcriptional regulator
VVATRVTSLPVQTVRRERRKDARPGELIDAALDVFGERGFAGARLEDIAHRAGVTKGTVYLYFASKEELFEAAVRQTLVSSIARGQATLRDFEGSTSDLLRTVLTGWWHGVVRTKAATLGKLMVAEASNFPALARFYYDNVIEPGRRLQARILERGIARGEFRRVPVEHTVSFIIAPLLYVQYNQQSFAKVIAGAAIDSDEFLAAFVDHLLASLAPRAERP